MELPPIASSFLKPPALAVCGCPEPQELALQGYYSAAGSSVWDLANWGHILTSCSFRCPPGLDKCQGQFLEASQGFGAVTTLRGFLDSLHSSFLRICPWVSLPAHLSCQPTALAESAFLHACFMNQSLPIHPSSFKTHPQVPSTLEISSSHLGKPLKLCICLCVFLGPVSPSRRDSLQSRKCCCLGLGGSGAWCGIRAHLLSVTGLLF